MSIVTNPAYARPKNLSKPSVETMTYYPWSANIESRFISSLREGRSHEDITSVFNENDPIVGISKLNMAIASALESADIHKSVRKVNFTTTNKPWFNAECVKAKANLKKIGKSANKTKNSLLNLQKEKKAYKSLLQRS